MTISPIGLTGSITVLANAICCNLTTDEIALLASVLVQLGDTMATIALSKSMYGESEKSEDNA